MNYDLRKYYLILMTSIDDVDNAFSFYRKNMMMNATGWWCKQRLLFYLTTNFTYKFHYSGNPIIRNYVRKM
jgi:hypothetical protein